MSCNELTHCFVDSTPDELEKGVLYISIEFAAVMHLCCCGCGSEIVTPLSPTDWKLTFNGESITLHPSIGNWSFPCRSHYWIRQNRIEWAPQWSDDEIRKGRKYDPSQINSSDSVTETSQRGIGTKESEGTVTPPKRFPLIRKIWNWFRRSY